MKKFIKAVKEYKYWKYKLNLENTYLFYDPDKNKYIVFINWSKEYLQNNFNFIYVY